MSVPPSPARAAARGSPEPGRPALLLLLLLLLLVLASQFRFAVPCVSGGVPKPTNITFLSINMKNILQWSPPQDLQSAEVMYTVQYFIYGQKKWLNKSECRNINETYCDLSAETSDYEHQYYARVKTIWEKNCSKWAETGRFYPFLETQIGPPEVALTTQEKSISIVLKAPEKWKKNPEESSIPMQQIYSNLKYNVSVYNTKSNRTWSQCVTNHTLVLTWLEPDTLYCVHVESFVPGPPRLAQPSERQCVSTLKDQSNLCTHHEPTVEETWKVFTAILSIHPFSHLPKPFTKIQLFPENQINMVTLVLVIHIEDQASTLKFKIIIWYILPISITVFILCVMGYYIYRYIHVGKEKHPANLVLIYGNEFDRRFFVPAEKIVINFITLNILEDSKTSHKDPSIMDNSDEGDLINADPNRDQEPCAEEMEVKHLGYASHLMDIFCDSEENANRAALSQQASLNRTLSTNKTVIEYEYDVRTSDLCVGWKDQELSLSEEVSEQGKLFEQQATLADCGPQVLQSSYTPQLRDLDDPLPQEPMDTGPETQEEPLTTLVDWDPQTGRLCIPSLPSFEHHAERGDSPEYSGLTEEGLLSRLYEAQTPDKPPEQNAIYLMQFMEEWGLSVQMED